MYLVKFVKREVATGKDLFQIYEEAEFEFDGVKKTLVKDLGAMSVIGLDERITAAEKQIAQAQKGIVAWNEIKSAIQAVAK